jgi:hypothetical protein
MVSHYKRKIDAQKTRHRRVNRRTCLIMTPSKTKTISGADMKQRNEQQLEQGPRIQQGVDISGYEFFSHGETGEAHAIAHRMFDCGNLETGRRLLGEWLVAHNGEGSDWVHLQFHMALFELELGNWQGAYKRFWQEILPIAATTQDALTDAPGLLWRLQITASYGIVLPWQPLRKTALNAMQHCTSGFVQIHNLLALAGAGDSRSIKYSKYVQQGTEHYPVIRKFSQVCVEIANGRFKPANAQLRSLKPELAQLDGSHAQMQLFDQLIVWTGRQCSGFSEATQYPDAA